MVPSVLPVVSSEVVAVVVLPVVSSEVVAVVGGVVAGVGEGTGGEKDMVEEGGDVTVGSGSGPANRDRDTTTLQH